MGNPEVDVTGDIPLPEGERLPSISDLGQQVPDQSAGMPPLDDMILDERLQVEGFSAYSEGGSGETRLWVRQQPEEEIG